MFALFACGRKVSPMPTWSSTTTFPSSPFSFSLHHRIITEQLKEQSAEWTFVQMNMPLSFLSTSWKYHAGCCKVSASWLNTFHFTQSRWKSEFKHILSENLLIPRYLWFGLGIFLVVNTKRIRKHKLGLYVGREQRTKRNRNSV